MTQRTMSISQVPDHRHPGDRPEALARVLQVSALLHD
jgi:hypothetical protein